MCPEFAIRESDGSKAGRGFKCAGKTSIPNLGEKVVQFDKGNGSTGEIVYQVADVSRPLNSVSEICDSGNLGHQVVFGRAGGMVLNLETGEQTHFGRDEGVYIMELWVKEKAGRGF